MYTILRNLFDNNFSGQKLQDIANDNNIELPYDTARSVVLRYITDRALRDVVFLVKMLNDIKVSNPEASLKPYIVNVAAVATNKDTLVELLKNHNITPERSTFEYGSDMWRYYQLSNLHRFDYLTFSLIADEAMRHYLRFFPDNYHWAAFMF